jgi:hypothetical protein
LAVTWPLQLLTSNSATSRLRSQTLEVHSRRGSSAIEQRREPLIADRNLASELRDVLEDAYSREQKARERIGENMPEPQYERYQIKSLEASAEVLCDSNLLREGDEWEKTQAGTILR